MASPFLIQMLGGMAQAQYQRQAEKDAEERELRVRSKIMDMEFEKQKQLHSLALEEKKRSTQEELGRQIMMNATYGMRLQENAHLISDDPEEQKRIRGIGQIMRQTGMGPDVVFDYLKATGVGKGALAQERLELARARLEFEQDKFAQLQAFKADLAAKKAPAEILKAQDAYNRGVSDMSKAIAKGEIDPQDALSQHMETINSNADIVENWRREVGLAPMGLAKVEIEDVPTTFFERLVSLGKKGKTKQELKLKKPQAAPTITAPTTKVLTYEDAAARERELIGQGISPEERKNMMLKEGFGEFIK